uniref:Uncharacterized protein n=1 Tax=Micromonospora robiginosa TaxID=2749844 RepID=A0A7L6B7I0_9ACTN
MRPLDESARAWVDLQLILMRRHASKASEASAKWNQLNDELMAKFRAEGRTDQQIAGIKGVNLALNDQYAAYAFHAGKAQLHAAVLQAELAARQMLDADDDPAGLRYSRDDEPPTMPVPPGVDGLSITGRPARPTNSPAGYTETRTRRLSRPGSNQPSAPVGGQGVGGQGVAGLGRPATPAPGGAR